MLNNRTIVGMGVRAMLLILMCVAGCIRTGPKEQAFDSPLPARRTDALTDRSKLEDPSTIPGRIELLDSDDPLVRMLALRSLEHMTGETFGYDHSGSQVERDQAVDRWVEWYERTGGAMSAETEPELP